MHGQGNQFGHYQFGPFRLAVSERQLLKNGKPIPLGGRALDILTVLLEQSGQVVSHKELINRVWPTVTVEEAGLRVHIAALRKALNDGQDGNRYISNVPGRGYCFVSDVTTEPRRISPVRPQISPPTDTLPLRPVRMVGREATLQALRAELDARRLISIVGPGGAGKTTVAIEFAHELYPAFRDGIYFIDLSALKEGSLIVPAVASALGCLEPIQESLTRLVSFISDRKSLLIIDSCEHVVGSAAEFVEAILEGAPNTFVIATTREPLRVDGEQVHLLAPLDMPAEEAGMTAEGALSSSSVQLFMDRAMAAGYRGRLTDEQAPIVSEICRRLDGMPLAIELTASRVSTYGIEGVAQLVGDRLSLVWQKRRGVQRHQTLQAMLDWSYNLLTEDERSLLCALSVFVGSFNLEMANAVASEPPMDATIFVAAVAGLAEKSLLSVTQTKSESLYKLLDTTRVYASLKLMERGEWDVVVRRHAKVFSIWLKRTHVSAIKHRDLDEYKQKVGDVRAALIWSESPSCDETTREDIESGAARLFLGLSLLDECSRLCRKLLANMPESRRGTLAELDFLLSLATASNHVFGDSAEVVAALEKGLKLADKLGATEYKFEYLSGLNLNRSRLTDFGGALSAAERYADLADRFDNQRVKVIADWMLGASYHLVGNHSAAVECYDRGFRRADANGIEEVHSFGYDHRVRALIGFGRTLWLSGFGDRGKAFSLQGIEFAEQLKHPMSLCICLTYSTQVFLWRRDYELAEDLIDRLLVYSVRSGLAVYHARAVGLRGELLLAKGQPHAGIECLRAATSAMGDEHLLLSASIRQALADGLASVGQIAEASAVIDTVLQQAEASITFELPDFLRTQAKIILATDPERKVEAEAILLRARMLAREHSSLGWELRISLELARLLASEQRLKEGRAQLLETYSRFTEGFGTKDLLDARQLLVSLE